MKEPLPGDLYDIGSRVKDIDPALALSFDARKGRYYLYRNKHLVMTIIPGELDERILTKLRQNDLARRRLQDFIYELEQSEDKREQQRAKELKNQIERITLEKYNQLVGIKQYALGGITR